jgi:glyoxylase-like metal-dependent hydrolase (beta-lactamase superfamily II)
VRILAWRVPPFDNGTYVVVDDRGDAICVDPSMGEREVMRAIRDEKLSLLAILNTHGHPDHIYGDAAVKEATHARLAIHRLDEYRLDPARRPAALVTGLDDAPAVDADDLLDEGPVAYLRDVGIEALHTPGHTEGSTCFYIPSEGSLFSGDVLFAGNVGRVDLPGGNASDMEKSLVRVAALPPATKVYPGHGPTTTIGAELRWLRGFRF